MHIPFRDTIISQLRSKKYELFSLFYPYRAKFWFSFLLIMHNQQLNRKGVISKVAK